MVTMLLRRRWISLLWLSTSKAIRNDQTRPKTRAIKNDQKRSNKRSSLPRSNSQGHPQPPNCSPEADHSHGCRSLFFNSCIFEHGRDDCPQSAHMRLTPLTIAFFFCKSVFGHGHFLGRQRWSLGLSGKESEATKNWTKKQSKTKVFEFGILGASDAQSQRNLFGLGAGLGRVFSCGACGGLVWLV